jgi:hypothetical protein
MTDNRGYAAAVAALVLSMASCASTTTPVATSAAKPAALACAGINSCKGMGECGSKEGSGCKGTNACKGQGFIYVATANACTDAGGTVL